MAIFRCENCKSVFGDDELAKYQEDRGEFWGSPCSETLYCCPCCHSTDYEEVSECADCGEYFSVDELHHDFCTDCLDGYRRNYAVLEKIAEKDTAPIELPSLISAVLSVEKIKTILYRYIEQNDVDCLPYIQGDYDWFAEAIKGEKNV